MGSLFNLIDRQKLLTIFIAGFLLSGSFMFLILFFTTPFNVIGCALVSSLAGILFGGGLTTSEDAIRKSNKFWDYAKAVEELINKSDSKDELKLIEANEFLNLRQYSQGGAHGRELVRLHAIMSTKYKYASDSDWEKRIEGKNVHSVFTWCKDCGLMGCNIPFNDECGNCGSKNTIRYYDKETIDLLF